MNGVLEYVEATLTVYFPKGHVYCWECPLLHRGRQMCMKTGETIEDVRSIGQWCELKFKEENNGEELFPNAE